MCYYYSSSKDTRNNTKNKNKNKKITIIKNNISYIYYEICVLFFNI